jgi:hypothetical protein
MEAPQKMVLPGEENIISDCAPGSTLCRPVGRSENRGQKNCDFKMKSEVAEGNLTSKRSQRLLSYPKILGLGFTLSAKL